MLHAPRQLGRRELCLRHLSLASLTNLATVASVHSAQFSLCVGAQDEHGRRQQRRAQHGASVAQ